MCLALSTDFSLTCPKSLPISPGREAQLQLSSSTKSLPNHCKPPSHLRNSRCFSIEAPIKTSSAYPALLGLFIVTPRSLVLLCTWKRLVTWIQQTFTIGPKLGFTNVNSDSLTSHGFEMQMSRKRSNCCKAHQCIPKLVSPPKALVPHAGYLNRGVPSSSLPSPSQST